MRDLGRAEIEAFLRAVDAQLTRPVEVIVVGGAVIALRFVGTHFTSDIDVWGSVDERLQAAVAAVNEKAVRAMPVQPVHVGSAPRTFEDRLVRVEIAGLKRLGVYVPEAHDFAIMKLARGYAHDLDAVEDVHRAAPLRLDTLVARYEETELHRRCEARHARDRRAALR